MQESPDDTLEVLVGDEAFSAGPSSRAGRVGIRKGVARRHGPDGTVLGEEAILQVEVWRRDRVFVSFDVPDPGGPTDEELSRLLETGGVLAEAEIEASLLALRAWRESR